MKKLILASLLLSFNSFAGISIISDLDDTIKVTNSDDVPHSLGYGVARRKVYTGIPEFLTEAKAAYVNDLNIVTASPRILSFNVKRLLRKHDIDAERIVLNGNFIRPNKFDFKVNAIKKILSESTDSFILMGDDVGEDPEIYDEIIKQFPDRIVESYIHVVKNRETPSSAIRYWTTFELAMRERQAGRLSNEAVMQVVNSFNEEKDLEAVFPEFAHCPMDTAPYAWLSATEFAGEALLLSERFVNYCKNGWENDG